jgi:hypothetical protein
LIIVIRIPHNEQWKNKKENPENLVQPFPETLHLKVSDVYKVGQYLPQHDGKVISEPTINKKQKGAE